MATPSQQETHGNTPVSGPEDRPHRSPRPANPTDVPAPPAHPFSGRLPPSNADGTDVKCHGSARTHTAGDTVHSGTRGPDDGADWFTQQPASGLPGGTLNSHSDTERSRSLRYENALLIAAARLRYAQLTTVLEVIEHHGCIQMKLAIVKCDRLSIAQHGRTTRALSTGAHSESEPTDDLVREPSRTHFAGPSGEPNVTHAAEPERHPNYPADPCDSFAGGHANSDERARSYERVVWAASLLETVLPQHDQDQGSETRGAYDQPSGPPESPETGDLDLIYESEAISSPTRPPRPEPVASTPLAARPGKTVRQQVDCSAALGDYGCSYARSNGEEGSLNYESATAPRSADPTRSEHMVNAAMSVDRDAVVRAGSGIGPLVSDDHSTRNLEHVSANKRVPPSEQDQDCLITTGRDGKVAHLQHHTFACGCAEERAARKRWATAVRSLTCSTVKHDRAGEVADAVAACWGIDDNGDISTACEDERRGWTPTDMTHHGDTWHIAGTTVFDEDAHWGGPADDEPGGDERHEQGHVCAPDGEVPYDKDWKGVERSADKAEASLRLLHRRVRSMADTSRW